MELPWNSIEFPCNSIELQLKTWVRWVRDWNIKNLLVLLLAFALWALLAFALLAFTLLAFALFISFSFINLMTRIYIRD